MQITIRKIGVTMRSTALRTSAILFIAATLAATGLAQKKPLTHDVYDSWQSTTGQRISNDGKWMAYALSPQQGNNKYYIKSVNGATEYTFDRGTNVRFSDDSKFVIATIVPDFEKAREETRKKVKTVDKTKNNLLIINLATGEKTEMERVTSYSIATEGSDWIVYRPEKPKPEPKKEDKNDGGLDQEPEKTQEPAKEEEEEEKKKKGHTDGYKIVARNLASGEETVFENISTYSFNKDGSKMYYVFSPKEIEGHGVFVHDFSDGSKSTIMDGLAKYIRMTFDEDGENIAILTDKDDYRAEKPSHSIYVHNVAAGTNKKVAQAGMKGVAEGWEVPSNSSMRWSKDSQRLFIGLKERPVEEPKDETPADEKVSIDVWSWTDEQLQPQQLLRAASTRNRQYEAIVDMGDGSITQYESKDHISVSLPNDGNGDYGISILPLANGAGATPDDIFLVDLKSGKPHLLLADFWGSLRWSPTGRWLVGWDSENDRTFMMDPRTKRKIDITDRVPHPLYNWEDDHPSGGGPYGTAGWNEDDSIAYVYDKFDIWEVPILRGEARNVTHGWGRTSNQTFRHIQLDRDAEFLDASKLHMLRSFDNEYKDAGFFSHTFKSSQLPRELVMDAVYYGFPTKARDADVLLFTRETASQSRDLYTSNLKFRNVKKHSSSNPQQKDYNWLTTELVEWTSLDGDRLQGIVYKPENIDYSKKYPLIAYFYEKNSQNLNRYRSPAPSASTINIPLFVSQGYIVFVPDIPYKIGYPGESAISAIVSGVNRVLADGYVDPDRLGIQGQSWGGYQVAYMVTETDMFAAAGAGAQVSNMFSAYGGIRWNSGLVRQLQYESGQTRIGGTMWEYPLRYLENSPIFFADKIKTPLLMMHNDKDGSVPWWQSIEMFTALHRLKKPAWLLNYNGEDHNLRQRKNRKDLSVRLSQFFDHYLKGAPMPIWMSEGVPATMKGKTYGFELSDKGG